ncbi:MAG: SAM-dependent methyltransferase [Pseudomonadota bacterium]
MDTSQPPVLTDRRALAARRARAVPTGMFLQHEAADDAKERLIEVNRAFISPVVVTPFPDVWDGFGATKADNDVLDLEPSGHDLVVHALSLHWSNDPIGQLIQCRRALRPDGLLIATLFGSGTLAELRQVLARAESEVTGGLSPRVLPMADIREATALLQRAGLALPVGDSRTLPVSYESAWHLMRDLRAMGEANALEGRLRKPTRPAVLKRASELYQDAFGAADGRVTATFEIITLTGWAPADSQQRPLRPGSAKSRLADALKTVEKPAGDTVS